MVRQIHFFQRRRSDPFQKIFFVVGNKDPPQIKQGISKPKIKMLVAVNFIILLCFAESQKRFCFDIVIDSVNIRIGMVNDIMLGSPHEIISTQEIQ